MRAYWAAFIVNLGVVSYVAGVYFSHLWFLVGAALVSYGIKCAVDAANPDPPKRTEKTADETNWDGWA